MNLKPTKYLLLLFPALYTLQAQPGGSPVFTHFSIEEGIPDRTVYQIIQDQQDYMWLATDQGICRFDGYEFWQPPGPEETKRSAFFPYEDVEGRIWFQHSNASLWYFEGDSIRPWRYNDRLMEYQTQIRRPCGYIIAKKSGYVWIFIEQKGILEVDSAGNETLLFPDENSSTSLLFVQDEQVFWTDHRNHENTFKTEKRFGRDDIFPVWQYKNGGWERIKAFWGHLLSQKYSGTILAEDTLLFYKANEGFYAIQSGQILWKTDLNLGHTDKLYITSTREIFVGLTEGKKGLCCMNPILAVLSLTRLRFKRL